MKAQGAWKFFVLYFWPKIRNMYSGQIFTLTEIWIKNGFAWKFKLFYKIEMSSKNFWNTPPFLDTPLMHKKYCVNIFKIGQVTHWNVNYKFENWEYISVEGKNICTCSERVRSGGSGGRSPLGVIFKKILDKYMLPVFIYI